VSPRSATGSPCIAIVLSCDFPRHFDSIGFNQPEACAVPPGASTTALIHYAAMRTGNGIATISGCDVKHCP
jgi:hypothetical protein